MQNGEEERDGRGGNGEEKEAENPPLMALNHVSRVCRSVEKSVEFYTKVLGFVLIERPESFDFDGAWLFNYGVGIHLVQCKDDEKLPSNKDRLDPMDNHISFQVHHLSKTFFLVFFPKNFFSVETPPFFENYSKISFNTEYYDDVLDVLLVRKHGSDGAEAERVERKVHEEDGGRRGGGCHRPTVLQRPGRIYGGDLQL